MTVYFTDWGNIDPENFSLFHQVNRRFGLTLNRENPDFLFHSVFSNSHLWYDCTKICWSGENTAPDFNVSDYGLGSDYLTFGDRYFRFPFWQFGDARQSPEMRSMEYCTAALKKKSAFCSFLYSNANLADPIRERFFHLLSEYKRVDSGGLVLNNIGTQVPRGQAENDWLRKHKFCIAFENSSHPGYTTEKICTALAADAIPIYWGDPLVTKEFNPRRFINCFEYDSLDAVVERVRELDGDDEKYLEVLREPWFTGDPPPLYDDNEALWNFLGHIFEQGPEKSRRVVRYGLNQRHIHKMKVAFSGYDTEKGLFSNIWRPVRFYMKQRRK